MGSESVARQKIYFEKKKVCFYYLMLVQNVQTSEIKYGMWAYFEPISEQFLI